MQLLLKLLGYVSSKMISSLLSAGQMIALSWLLDAIEATYSSGMSIMKNRLEKCKVMKFEWVQCPGRKSFCRLDLEIRLFSREISMNLRTMSWNFKSILKKFVDWNGQEMNSILLQEETITKLSYGMKMDRQSINLMTIEQQLRH